MMFEKQREMGDTKAKGSSSSPLEEPSAAPSDTVLPSPPAETSNEEHDKVGSSSNILKAGAEESSQNGSRKQMGSEAEVIDEDEAAQPTKRMKSS